MTINLSTSDEPPVVVSVPRVALIAHSRVFSDMLSLDLLKSDTFDHSIPLSETHEELKPWTTLVKGKQDETEKTLKGMSEEEWENLAKLADKYDCWAILKVVEAKAWQVEAEKGNSAFAFTLATLTGNVDVIKTTAKRAVLIRDLNSSDLHAGDEWKERLAAWRTVQTAACFDRIRAFAKERPSCRQSTNSYCSQRGCIVNSETEWLRFVNAAICQFDVCSIPPINFDKLTSVCTADVCHEYKTAVRRSASRLYSDLSQWVEFPVTGLTFGSMQNSLRYK